jgi:serine/threonine protein kinase
MTREPSSSLPDTPFAASLGENCKGESPSHAWALPIGENVRYNADPRGRAVHRGNRMTASALVGTVLDGKFQIEKALSSGATGDVYEALHLGLGSPVAVKVLRPGIPETADIRRRRFMREARVAAQIQSDHVVRVFDIVAPEEGPTYIVMELLQGETLAERLRRVGHVSVSEAIDYVMQAAKPLGTMHEAGIVHRDVKPSNLFLTRDADGKERIKLLDFGVAAFQQPLARRGSELTFTEAVIGTPRYMAPEQVRSAKQVDARADVWALGVTLYELLAGSPPFDGKTVLAVLNQIEVQEPPSLAARRPDVSPELAALVHRCLAKDPEKRPASGRALATLLAPLAAAGAQKMAGASSQGDPERPPMNSGDVELLRSLLAGTTATPVETTAPRRKVVAIAALVGVIAAFLLFVASGRTREPEPESTGGASSAAAASAMGAAGAGGAATASGDGRRAAIATFTVGELAASASPPPASPAPRAPTTTATVIPAPRDNTTAHRAPEPTHAPAAQRKAAPKPTPRTAPPKSAATTRSSTEDDDRIE